MVNIYENTDEYNTNKNRKYADFVRSKKLQSIVTELFTKSRKINISHVFIT